MKDRFLLCAFILIFVTVTAGAWEGNAAIAPAGELPEDGFFVATNSFPRNTVVEVRNIENNKSIRVIVASGLNSQGLLALVSRSAAQAIGISSSSVARIELTQPADPIGYSLFTQGRASNRDPDFDPQAQYFDESVIRDSRSSGTRQEDRIVDLPDYGVPLTSPSQRQSEQPSTAAATRSEPQERAQVESYNWVSDFEPGLDLVYTDPSFRSGQRTPAQAAVVPVQSVEPPLTYVEPAPEQENSHEKKVVAEEVIANDELAQVERGPDYDSSDSAVAYADPIFRPGELAVVAEEAEAEEALAQAEQGPDSSDDEKAVAYTEPDYRQPSADPFYPGDDVILVMEPADLNPPDSEIYIDDVYIIRPLETSSAQNAAPGEVIITAPFLPPIPSLYPPEPIGDPSGPMVPPIVYSTTPPPQIYLPPETGYLPPTTAVTSAVNDVARKFSVPVIAELEKGKYYLQLGSYEVAEAIEAELNRIGRTYPLAIQQTIRTDKPVYRILLGPLNIGESNAVLQRFKSAGYDDAFLRYN